MLRSLNNTDLEFKTFEEHLSDVSTSSNEKYALLRHDVDRIPQNALKLAQIENSLGIKGTYYFRVVPESYDLDLMNNIAELGHEIGYHYEDVDLVISGQGLGVGGREELIDLAYESFCKNLEIFRRNFDIKTICMHGSPRAEFDNKIIWEKYDYKELGIIGEPYFDLDFEEFAYLTDTGRMWNGEKYSVRDKVKSVRFGELNNRFRTTKQIIENINLLPEKVMITIHPERWTNNPYQWTKQYVMQNLKNVVKGLLVKQ